MILQNCSFLGQSIASNDVIKNLDHLINLEHSQ